MTCACGGRKGWFPVRAIETHRSHFRRKGEADFALVNRRVTFKCPCECTAGRVWLAERRGNREEIKAAHEDRDAEKAVKEDGKDVRGK